MDRALSLFDQLKSPFHGVLSSGPTVDLTPEQRRALLYADEGVPARDPETKREYVILKREVFDKIKRVLDIDEVEPSIFEFEEIDTVIDAPRTL